MERENIVNYKKGEEPINVNEKTTKKEWTSDEIIETLRKQLKSKEQEDGTIPSKKNPLS